MCPALVLGNLVQRRRAEMFNGGLELSMYASVTRRTTFPFFAPLLSLHKAHGVGESVRYACIA